MKNAIIEVLDNLIFGMREGREPEDIMQDDTMKKEISNTYLPVMTPENAVETEAYSEIPEIKDFDLLFETNAFQDNEYIDDLDHAVDVISHAAQNIQAKLGQF